MKSVYWAAVAAVVMFSGAGPGAAANWPQWRYDAGRTADSPERLGTNLTLRWTIQYSPRTPAWEDPLNQDLMPFDLLFEPIVVGNRMFLGFNDRDKLVAVDIRTGREAWTFYTDGPVRLPPAAVNGKLFFVSDDGYLYCVRSEDGSLIWKFRGGPSNRKILGNSRLIGAWPARGGPVIRDNTVYFAASIWPFMGTFIYALDVENGEVKWVNDSNGALYMKQPHSAPAFGGVAPQGALVATAKTLLVPGGRSVPAAFDRQTGKFLYYELTDSGKGTGGSLVMANENEFLVHTRNRGVRAHELANGKRTSFIVNEPVLGHGHYYAASDYPSNYLAVVDSERKLEEAQYNYVKAQKDYDDAMETGDRMAMRNASNTLASMTRRLGRAVTNLADVKTNLPAGPLPKVIQAWNAGKKLEWEIEADGSGDLIRAGGQFYAAGEKAISAIAPPRGRNPATIVWSHAVTNQVRRLLAAQGMLFAVTLEGHILAFGEGTGPAAHLKPSPATLTPSPAASARAKTVLAQSGIQEGYAFCLGLEDADLPIALAMSSNLRIIAVDADTNKVERLRRQWDAAGWYGERVALLAANPADFGASPYLASLIVADETVGPELAQSATPGVSPALASLIPGGAAFAQGNQTSGIKKTYESVRPYGGKLWLSGAAAHADLVRSASLAQAKVATSGKDLLITREGAIPGSAPWSHQYGDVANSVKSEDKTVKLPVGVLWFGGNTHLDVLPRHGHGPSEQVAGGRLFIEGMDCISARDVYTGQRLWKTVIPGLDTSGIYYDDTLLDSPFTTLYSQRHIPGANARGANFVVTADRVYVAVSNHCAVLDAATGKIIQDIEMPGRQGKNAGQWTYIGIYDDVLLGGTDFALFNQRFGGHRLSWPPPAADLAACNGLTAFDRMTGKVLWQVDAKYSFIHNGIVAGRGLVYCLDRWPKSVEAKLRQRRQPVPSSYRVVAFDARTGKQVWEQNEIVSCSWLGYSKAEDLVLLAGANATDRLKDETSSSMQVLQATDGATLWKRSGDMRHNGPCILYNDLIVTTPTAYTPSAGAFRLRDGKPHEIINPLTGTSEPWKIYRTYGCNTPIASEYIMTFRSGAAGFYDMENHSGFGNLGGFKSGCSANLIIADGVMNAPDYTRTCSCPYQNQTSLGLVHMPELEVWTCNLSGLTAPTNQRIQRVGFNLGAPGDRLADDGTLWLEFPLAADVSPKLLVSLNYMGITNAVTNMVNFRRHSSAVSGEGPAWIFASGMRDVERLVITPQTLRPTPPSRPARSSEDDDDDDDDPTKGSSSTNNVNGNGASNTATNVAGESSTTNRDSTSAGGSDTNSVASGADTSSTSAAASTNAPSRGGFGSKGGFGKGGFSKGGFSKGGFGRGGSTNTPPPITSESLPELEPANYTVRLYFSEPDEVTVGARVFDIELQSNKVLEGFDIIKETGEPFKGVIKEFKGVKVTKDLKLKLLPVPGTPLKPVLSGIELVQEN